jgi:hypothetical protein
MHRRDNSVDIDLQVIAEFTIVDYNSFQSIAFYIIQNDQENPLMLFQYSCRSTIQCIYHKGHELQPKIVIV